MYLTKLEHEMKLLIEGALGIMDSRVETPPAIILWQAFARDLLRRINSDTEILPRDQAGSHVPPAARSQDCPQVVAARDGDGHHNATWIDPS